MGIFELHQNVLADYRDFVRSFFLIADERARAFVDKALVEEQHLWPEPLVQLSPAYAPGPTVEELAREGLVTEETARSLLPAGRRALSPLPPPGRGDPQGARRGEHRSDERHGLGKELVLFPADRGQPGPNARHRGAASRRSSCIPMNALVNSQFQALSALKERYERALGRPFPVTFAKYTGETTDAARERCGAIRRRVLLTNYVMAELLLVRPEDQRFLDRAGGGLRFLVFDELHTYRGRQGADVAMLVRRLKERCAAGGLVHIGTSATMIVSAGRQQGGAAAELWPTSPPAFSAIPSPRTGHRRDAFAVHRGRLALRQRSCGRPFPMRCRTISGHCAGTRSCAGSSTSWASSAKPMGRLKRRVPRPLPEVARQLSEATGADAEQCARAPAGTSGSRRYARRRGRHRAVAFKLHQFVAQGRTLYATLEGRERASFRWKARFKRARESFFSRSSSAANAVRTTTTRSRAKTDSCRIRWAPSPTRKVQRPDT
ncbi:MAG: hypothetical protein KatS3mg102_0337 [Planctomycetota bacterium]|nr:MAG: hypothetical protein KatS3mg102_0337 [Planctomycetota bacterium]